MQGQNQRILPTRPQRLSPQADSHGDRSPEPPALPTSPPPALPGGKVSSVGAEDPRQALAAIEASIVASDHSRQASLEIEEYDLDRNFPDSHQSASARGMGSGRNRSVVGTEYRLDGGLGSSSGQEPAGQAQHQLEGEHAKLVRLVHMQQERLKTQESQLSLVNTQIVEKEEKEQDYEERLHVIMEELLLQETKQRDFDVELGDLERVEWANVLHGEQQREVDLNLKIASLKAKIIEHEHKLDDVKAQEGNLLVELKEEQRKLEEERERLKEEEARSKKEEARNGEEISRLQLEFLELRKKGSECESSLVRVFGELSSVDKDLQDKTKELKDLEASLKDETLKDFAARPEPTEEVIVKETGETVIRILEGRVSPRSAQAVFTTTVSRKKASDIHAGSAPIPAISGLTTKNQSGVWV